MTNWKTTVGGLLIAVGSGLQGMQDGTYQTIGKFMIAVGGLILGLSAKDFNVTGGTKQQ